MEAKQAVQALIVGEDNKLLLEINNHFSGILTARKKKGAILLRKYTVLQAIYATSNAIRLKCQQRSTSCHIKSIMLLIFLRRQTKYSCSILITTPVQTRISIFFERL